MIDLEIPTRTVAGVDVAGDDEDPFAFWILPPPPRISAAADGTPLVSLLRFVNAGQLTGGLIELTVELSHPPGVLEAARAQLVADLKDEHDRVTFQSLLLYGGEVELLFLGRETKPDGSITAVGGRSYRR